MNTNDQAESKSVGSGKVAEKVRKLVSRDQIRQAMALPRKEVYIPQWDADIVLQGFTMKQAEAAKNASKVEDDQGNSVVDEDLLNRAMLKLGIVEPRLTSEDVEAMFDMLPSSMIGHLINELAKLNNQDGEVIRKAQDAFRAQS